MSNIFDMSEINNFDNEVLEELLSNPKVKIERIVSTGQVTPEGEWYDQDNDEWLILLEGQAKILFEEGVEISLQKGTYLHIPARKLHRVTFTSQNPPCIWLAIHF